ncbi:MAG TPA: ester cyclase [Thermoanaerobaculia bacterium]|nr:ester cyclase [Thermoanaerobaculia bacterium]
MLEMKKAALLLLAGVVVFSASLSAESAEKRKAVARRVFEEIFNQGRFEVADEIYAKDFVNHGATRDIGLKEDQEAARGWRSAFPDLKMKVDKTLVDGEFVTVLWSGGGTNTGEGNGLPATGKTLKGRGITIWRISGGKIREEWSEFDQMRIMRQLGLLPAPPQP